MKPNASNHNPSPRYLRSLIAESGLSMRKTSDLIGMSWTGFRNYLRDEADPLFRSAPYTVQFALECLAVNSPVGANPSKPQAQNEATP